jgi:membrane fusion protein (multidrug efflux system)
MAKYKSENNMMRKMAVLTTFAAFVACNGQVQTNSPATGPVPGAIDTVAVFILKDTSVTKKAELTAELLPYEKSELFARVQGYVKEMRVDLGDRVKRGQTLALIEAPELQTRSAEFESSLGAARAKYMSSLDVFQRMEKASRAKTAGIVAPVDLERSRNQLMADSASYQAASRLAQSYRQVAGYLAVQAPFNGTVTARNADRGALVGNNQVLLTVQDNRRLRLRIAVPELYVASGTAGKQVSFRVDAFPEKLFMAELARKSGVIDTETRTEIWEYAVDNRNNELKAGSFAYVTLALQRSGNSLLVPPSALATTQERKFVILVKDGKAEWVDVRQGMSTDKGIEVFGNITNGDTLLARATDERKPGYRAYWQVSR